MAVQGLASDVHIEPTEQGVRSDSVLMVICRKYKPSPKSYPAIVSRIKIMGNLDISEKRISPGWSHPPDNRWKKEFPDILVTLHTRGKMVLRILDRAHALMSLNELGFSSANREKIETHPSPSWHDCGYRSYRFRKDSTLYSMLTEINIAQHPTLLP